MISRNRRARIRASTEGDGGSGVDGFENGSRKAMAKLGPDKSYKLTEEANAIIVDQVVAGPTGTAYSKRIAGTTGSQLHGLTSTCVAPEAVCVAALASLTVDRTGFLSLQGRPGSKLDRIAELIGELAVYVAVPLVALTFFRRSRTKKPARGSQQPGSG